MTPISPIRRLVRLMGAAILAASCAGCDLEQLALLLF